MKSLYANFKSGQFTGLIVASKYDVSEIIAKLEPLLAPSSPIVVYAAYKESLIPCYNTIRYSPKYVLTTLQESWMREYQAPPGTHPTMTTSGCGGFYFSCTTVSSEGVELNTEKVVKKAKVEINH
jgi:hypothetical protein